MKASRRASALALGLWMSVAAVLAACGKTAADSGTDSSTHWLQRCQADSDCGDLACVCGACSIPCRDVTACPDVEQTVCQAAASEGCSYASALCSAPCQSDGDCDRVRPGLLCSGGQCRAPEVSPGGGGAGGAGAGGGGSAGTTATDCSDIPQCEFACPEGTVNPVDERGCTHGCECAAPGTPAGSLRMYMTCGDPVCSGHTPRPGVEPCGSEAPGSACRVEGGRCDPQDSCNALLLCASSDPMAQPGGCPISKRDYKTDIHPVGPEELAALERELRSLKLATWRYKSDPTKTRLGIIIEDNASSLAVDPARNMVDVYGYASLAVAALQRQAAQLEALRGELDALKKQCAAEAPRTPGGARR